jgi:hypothetical protein
MKALIIDYISMKSQLSNKQANSSLLGKIKIEDCNKIEIAQYGANKLFGDWDARQKMFA